MKKKLSATINQKIEKLLSYQGCGKIELTTRKALWTSTFFGFLHVLILTFSFLFFVPELTILIKYGFTCLAILSITLLVIPFLKKAFNRYITLHLLSLILVTFYTIYQLGGIATSAGLIVAGLSFVLLSIPLQTISVTIFMFVVYSVFIVFIGFIGPNLAIPEQITTLRNSIIWMINTLSMSALSVVFVVDSIRQQRKFEHLEASKQKELNEAKTKLFTNITHEFRTPLTIIQGMSDLIQQKPDQWLTEGTHKISKNSQILLKLVNQMLDISKIEAGSMPVKKIQADINPFISYYTELFRSVAHEKNIGLYFTSDNKPVVMDFDPEKLMHIITNLLSNAFKFTPENGRIEVKTHLKTKKRLFVIKVIDSGIGIQKEHLFHIFDRFYQLENNLTNNGTGLGLAIVKEFTEMLSGSVTVESDPGAGTIFTLQLPQTNDATTDNQILPELFSTREHITLHQTNNAKKTGLGFSEKNELPLLLIVEDSEDVSLYLNAILQNEYNIELAGNGKKGLNKSLELIPDIILSDVMMPEMDGIEMLGKIKNDFRTSHIPVVMLTAKADIDSRLTGLERGADAYISKPFNEAELHIQLKNLVEQRKKLHERYASFAKYPETKDLSVKTEDAFMVKIRSILEKNMDNEDYTIHELCSEMAVSHAQLYRKFKSISNQTIAGYFKLLRLNKANELLAGQNINVTQVAFAVGFKNLSHFSREYSQLFGKSPSETLRQN